MTSQTETKILPLYVPMDDDVMTKPPEGFYKQCLSFSGWLCELATVCFTLNYLSLQFEDASSNGFCLPHLTSHMWCAAFDVLVWLLAESSRWRVPTGSGYDSVNRVLSFALLMHVLGHSYLFATQPPDSTVASINVRKHWSFTWVLILVNLTYCVPRLVLYPPTDTDHRAAAHEVVKSCGIWLLMQLATLALVECDLLLLVGGHLVYDLSIAVVALSHMYLLEYEASRTRIVT